MTTVSRAALAFILICTAPVPAQSGAALQEVASFALGGVGVAGTMSEGERALREVLKRPDAVSLLENDLPDASPAGRLYALVGLRLRDRAAYQRALERYRANDTKVQTMRGCILQRESFRDLAEEIDRGGYDSFLRREWPEDTR